MEGSGVVVAVDEVDAGVARVASRPVWSPLAAVFVLVALAALAGCVIAICLDVPAFFDNEGRYAEVAREMLARGDWVTPELDQILFLNKPPLLYWLTALNFHLLGGPTEWARLVTVVTGMVTLVATGRLGARLYGVPTGLLAAALLATSTGFALEARTLRPDSILITSVTVAILCWLRADAGGTRRTPWLVAMYATLGIGVLAKGLVPVVVAAIPIGIATLRWQGWSGIAALRPGLGLVVLAIVVLPWHVVVALRHPGFAWDYIVNQHLLFFLDRKEPRDSEGDPLAFFWGALVARSAPWVLLVPFTVREAIAGARGARDSTSRAALVLWTWAGGLMVFFSAAPSRLEHYVLPATPAIALLAARGWALLHDGRIGRWAWGYLGATAVVMVALGIVGLGAGRTLLGRAYWIPEVPDLLGLVAPAGAVVLLGGAICGFAVTRQASRLLLVGLAASAVPLVGIVLRAEALAEPLFSWRPVARALAGVPPETDIVFEAPEEYQIVGGLAYYTGRHITLLEVPGYIPPGYLTEQVKTMFLPRDEFARRWQVGVPQVLVSDSQRRRDTPDGLVPGAFQVLAHFGDRWILTNASGAR
jgi:4-amino-4-deoxy-L-arabinose transferase-like glycosyltransferase